MAGIVDYGYGKGFDFSGHVLLCVMGTIEYNDMFKKKVELLCLSTNCKRRHLL